MMGIEVWGPIHKSAVKNSKFLSTADATDIDLRIESRCMAIDSRGTTVISRGSMEQEVGHEERLYWKNSSMECLLASTRVRNIIWGGLRDHDPDQCQEQPGRADQVKDGLHQIRQRKGADLTCKAREVD